MTVHKLHPSDDPDVILEEAKGAFAHVCVFGYNSHEELSVISSTSWTQPEILFALEQLKLSMLMGSTTTDDE